jgi:hypothetical protein
LNVIDPGFVERVLTGTFLGVKVIALGCPGNRLQRKGKFSLILKWVTPKSVASG